MFFDDMDLTCYAREQNAEVEGTVVWGYTQTAKFEGFLIRHLRDLTRLSRIQRYSPSTCRISIGSRRDSVVPRYVFCVPPIAQPRYYGTPRTEILLHLIALSMNVKR